MPPLRLDGGLLDLSNPEADEGVEPIGLAGDHVLDNSAVNQIHNLTKPLLHFLADEVLELDGEDGAGELGLHDVAFKCK